MDKTVTTTFKTFLILLLCSFMFSCSDSSPTQPKPDPQPDPKPENPSDKPTRFDDIGPVADDGILETVAWNLKCYGTSSFCADGEVDQQTKHFLTVLDSLNADLYAFEELANQQALNLLALNMKGYNGFVAKNMAGTQITGFVYNTNVIDSISTGLLRVADPGDWGSSRYPRYPFYFKFAYHTQSSTYTIYAVVLHAEAGANARDYNSRKDGAQALYNYLVHKKPDVKVIVLGDYNDDVDVSIYQKKNTPYKVFVKDNNSFEVVTKEVSRNEQTTYIDTDKNDGVVYDDAIDHITISDELFKNYVPKSAKAVTKVNEWLDISVTQYAETTTEHYPVLAKFNF